ncbi:hypothetical protein GNI_136010 [Gregarina niphandrodes]|uniref:Uncharacterized protein n=1 Tax=Gregarina niphandrodes TaxID=110365 RepID=A0A023B0U5_GRENI|nr:hypothetical protein GNI_136010 [Gregarina niphandrodes]EZG45965.1 hypothetical protein GNI_136010 [Gregarina niphandrodes]|eukprot:XP_011132405.1 hypothetical protein GNI_136010 [Gregarina niphandrodes]
MKGVACTGFGGMGGSMALVLTVPSTPDFEESETNGLSPDGLSPEWKITTLKESSGDRHDDIDTDRFPEPTASFYRRPWFLIAVGSMGVTTLGVLGWLCFRHSGDSSDSQVLSEETAVSSYSPCDATVFGASDVLRYEHALSCDCEVESKSDWIMRCKPDPRPRGLPRIEDKNPLLSPHELATLRVPSEFSIMSYYNKGMKVPFEKAEANGWQKLGWRNCGRSGGKIYCSDGEDFFGHYFGVPFKFDFVAVWEAIAQYLKPTTCSFQCHDEDQLSRLRGIRRGIAAGKWAGIDVHRATEDKLYDLGTQAFNLTEKAFSWLSGDCFESDMIYYANFKARRHHAEVTDYLDFTGALRKFYEVPIKTRHFRTPQYDGECWYFPDSNAAKLALRLFWENSARIAVQRT